MFIRLFFIACLMTTIAACSTNPVTGQTQFSLVSPEQEVQIGEKNFVPYQQQQGGKYTVDPELSVYVSSVGQKLAAVSHRPKLPYEFVVLNNNVPNAWALPGGKIAINRGLLLYMEDEAQLAAVLAHEIVHAAARHGATQQTQQTLLGIGVGLTGLAATQSEYGGLLAMGAGVGAGAWQAGYSRAHEAEADFHGIEYMAKAGYDPQAAVELQEIFVRLSANKQQPGLLEGLFATHPPSQQRVKNNKKTATMFSGTIRNKAQYKRAIAQIVKDKDAYEKNAQAVKVAQGGDLSKGINLARSAVNMQNQEPLFHITLAQLLYQKKDYRGAEQSFSKASTLYPEYYAGNLGLGVTQFQQKKYSVAEKSLKKSLGIVPTVPATFYLGEISLKQGKKSQAVEYYKYAAQANNEMGKTAKRRLQELQPQQTQIQ